MKTSDKLTEKTTALFVGAETPDIYLGEISWNLRTMMGQADVLETMILEMKNQMREYIAAAKQRGG